MVVGRTLLFESTSRPLTTLISEVSCGIADASVNIRLLVLEYCVRCNVAPRSESSCASPIPIENVTVRMIHPKSDDPWKT
jgi:hypothetical protein